MPRIEMVCLANSRKLGERCVAGVRTDGGGWVRPVATPSGGALPLDRTTTDRGHPVGLLEVVEIDVEGPVPLLRQPENWLVRAERWRYVGDIEAACVGGLVPATPGDGRLLLGSTGDRVAAPELLERPIPRSLDSIHVCDVRWVRTRNHHGNRQIRARFRWEGQPYDLVVTDPVCEARFESLQDGEYSGSTIGMDSDDGFLLTISLSEPLGSGYCFKLVAGVVRLSSNLEHSVLGGNDLGEPLAKITSALFGVSFSGTGRFSQEGWTYKGPTDHRCPSCGQSTHVARKPYVSAGKQYRYWAFLCPSCERVWAPTDFGPEERKQIYG
jgi:hypothetical protein